MTCALGMRRSVYIESPMSANELIRPNDPDSVTDSDPGIKL